MTRQDALTGMDAAIAKASGSDLEILVAHRARMVAGWKDDDAKLEVRIARRKQLADEWMKGIDFRVR